MRQRQARDTIEINTSLRLANNTFLYQNESSRIRRRVNSKIVERKKSAFRSLNEKENEDFFSFSFFLFQKNRS